ncbi:MAG: pseudouridine-5'-phosphate glycosidase [Acidimicrobiales bacterium]
MSDSVVSVVRVGDAVREALDAGRGVVALETTLIVHGLPRPENLEVARELEKTVTSTQAVPATIGVLRGTPVVGLADNEIEQLANSTDQVAKLSTRDLGFAIAKGLDGATTVASTITLATRAGIAVMATGGLGGVHRHARETYDESADLTALSKEPVIVVCSGVKSILDVQATLERLETLAVPVAGYRTEAFPGFYVRETPHRLNWRFESPGDVATAFRAHRRFSDSAMVIANPVPESDALSENLHAAALAQAEEEADVAGVSGKDVTPFLLARFAEYTKGASVRANRALVIENAKLAGEIAVELANR